MLDESGTYGVGCCQIAASGKKIVNSRNLELECTRVLHDGLLVPVLIYGSETVV